jgi:hypothetical protein
MRLGPELEIEPAIVEKQPKLVKAAAALAHIHDLYDQTRRLKDPGRSKVSCILCALTCQDFLRRIGFTDAQVMPVYTLVRAYRDEVDVWSVGVGDHSEVAKHLVGHPVPKGPGWNGHLVTVVPSANAFLDLTAFQLQRAEWWPSLPGMFVAAIDGPDIATEPFPGMRTLGCVSGMEDDGTKVIAAWLMQPWNRSWKQAPDAHREQRRDVVAALAELFGKWRNAA